MKPSHFETPRTLDNCTFQSWGQAIFPPERTAFVPGHTITTAALIVAAVGFAVFLLKALP